MITVNTVASKETDDRLKREERGNRTRNRE